MAKEEDRNLALAKPPCEQKTGDFQACLKSYYLNSRFADLTIATAYREFKVHKLIVCSQSGYFSRMFSGDWLETNQNTVKLKDDDPRALEIMIEFMYGFEYDSSEGGRSSTMMFQIGAYQIADKYDVPMMKKYAKQKFESIIKVCWNIDGFSSVISEVYRTTPTSDMGLRDPLIRVTSEHLEQLMAKDDFTEALEGTTGFAVDLARHILNEKKILEERLGFQRAWISDSDRWGQLNSE